MCARERQRRRRVFRLQYIAMQRHKIIFDRQIARASYHISLDFGVAHLHFWCQQNKINGVVSMRVIQFVSSNIFYKWNINCLCGSARITINHRVSLLATQRKKEKKKSGPSCCRKWSWSSSHVPEIERDVFRSSIAIIASSYSSDTRANTKHGLVWFPMFLAIALHTFHPKHLKRQTLFLICSQRIISCNCHL